MVVSESELVCWPGSLGLSALHVACLWKDNGLPAQGFPLPDGSALLPPVSSSTYSPITWLDPASLPRGPLLSFLSPGLSSRKPP